MVITHHATQNSDILSIANLYQKLSATRFNLANQYVIPVLRDPHQMYGESGDTMASGSVAIHRLNVPALWTCVATKVLH